VTCSETIATIRDWLDLFVQFGLLLAATIAGIYAWKAWQAQEEQLEATQNELQILQKSAQEESRARLNDILSRSPYFVARQFPWTQQLKTGPRDFQFIPCENILPLIKERKPIGTSSDWIFIQNIRDNIKIDYISIDLEKKRSKNLPSSIEVTATWKGRQNEDIQGSGWVVELPANRVYPIVLIITFEGPSCEGIHKYHIEGDCFKPRFKRFDPPSLSDGRFAIDL